VGLSISYSLKVTLELSLTVRIKRNNPHFFRYIILLYIKTMGILFFFLYCKSECSRFPLTRIKANAFSINIVTQYPYVTATKITTNEKILLILKNKILYVQTFFIDSLSEAHIGGNNIHISHNYSV